MRQVDTDALLGVAGALGVGNPATAVQAVTFDDDNLQQALVVNDLVRRSRTGVGTSGLFADFISTVPAGAGQDNAARDYYALSGGVSASATYPPDMDGFDAWILGPISLTCTAGILVGAQLHFLYPTTRGVRVPPAGTLQARFGVWNAEVAIAGLQNFGATPDGRVVVNGAWRVPRGTSVQFITQASGAGTIRVDYQVGIFPAGLGQDAVGAA